MLWLIGMMGSGKSTVGLHVAEVLELPFVDLDDRVTAAAGAPIDEFFVTKGEGRFREIESATLAEVADGEPAVVATGGGVVMEERNVTRMRATGTVVWLTGEPSTLADRIGDAPGRPLLDAADRAERLADLLDQRLDRYSAAAHRRVATDGRSPTDVAEEVIRLWRDS